MNFDVLTGKTLKDIEILKERIVFTCDDGTCYASYHLYDYCELVRIEDVIGDKQSIIGLPILEARETLGHFDNPVDDYSRTTTCQYLRTTKGRMTFIWVGVSNGYYSEVPYFDLTHGH